VITSFRYEVPLFHKNGFGGRIFHACENFSKVSPTDLSWGASRRNLFGKLCLLYHIFPCFHRPPSFFFPLSAVGRFSSDKFKHRLPVRIICDQIR
jgi:hypothetical protein